MLQCLVQTANCRLPVALSHTSVYCWVSVLQHGTLFLSTHIWYSGPWVTQLRNLQSTLVFTAFSSSCQGVPVTLKHGRLKDQALQSTCAKHGGSLFFSLNETGFFSPLLTVNFTWRDITHWMSVCFLVWCPRSRPGRAQNFCSIKGAVGTCGTIDWEWKVWLWCSQFVSCRLYLRWGMHWWSKLMLPFTDWVLTAGLAMWEALGLDAVVWASE